MASSPHQYISSEELLLLAHQIGSRVDIPKLVRSLGVDPKIVDEGIGRDRAQATFNVLCSWRDDRPIGSNIRDLLEAKLREQLPEEKERLLGAMRVNGKKTRTVMYAYSLSR